MKSVKWFEAIKECEQQGKAYVIATVLGVSGSSPRDQGSKMVITSDEEIDTLGGGHLEYKVMEDAREVIAGGEAGNHIKHYPLGASLGQCCGGSVTVLLESFVSQGLNLTVFGAGHVAKALMKILGDMPGQIRWVDNRIDMFGLNVPTNVQVMYLESPVDMVATLPANSQVLILTHNHQLDFELCCRAIEHGKLRHIGLIGSMTKAQRFKKRLQHRTYSEEQVAQIICPVGLKDVPGKLPMEVAVSIAGQLIAIENQDKQTPLKRGLAWKTLKQELGRDVDNETLGYRLKI